MIGREAAAGGGGGGACDCRGHGQVVNVNDENGKCLLLVVVLNHAVHVEGKCWGVASYLTPRNWILTSGDRQTKTKVNLIRP